MTKAKFNFILTTLAKQLYQRFQRSYRQIHGKPLPVILVSGNIGKTSQTRLLAELFEAENYQVWTGTTANKNLNTLTGLMMVLSENYIAFETLGSLAKLKFVLTSGWLSLVKKWDFANPKQVLIFEVGIDHQAEFEDYKKIFGQVDWVLLSNFGPEHTAAFDSTLDLTKREKIQTKLSNLNKNYPAFWTKLTKLEPTLQNCYLEQLDTLTIAKNFVLPRSLELASDHTLIQQKNQTIKTIEPKISRAEESGILSIDQIPTPKEYLLPRSFARNLAMTSIIALDFGISKPKLQQIIRNIQLPNGRFGRLQGLNKSTIIDGSYNSDPYSLAAFLQLLEEVQAAKDNHLVLGEMRELGDSEIATHTEFLVEILELQKRLVRQGRKLEITLLGSVWKSIDSPILANFPVYTRVGEIIAKYQSQKDKITQDTWFWIKGSQNTIFLEALVESLLANPDKDLSRLARRGQQWDKLRAKWL